jgi:hypothetical protein
LSLELEPLSVDVDVLAGVDGEDVPLLPLSPLLLSLPDFSLPDFSPLDFSPLDFELASGEDFFA